MNPYMYGQNVLEWYNFQIDTIRDTNPNANSYIPGDFTNDMGPIWEYQQRKKTWRDVLDGCINAFCVVTCVIDGLYTIPGLTESIMYNYITKPFDLTELSLSILRIKDGAIESKQEVKQLIG